MFPLKNLARKGLRFSCFCELLNHIPQSNNFPASKHQLTCYDRVPTDKVWKISMIFQWYFKTKVPNFHDNYERFKKEKHRTTYYTCVFKKIYKVFLTDLMYSISANKEYVKYIFIYPCMSISEFNDFSMSNWPKIQWFFHDFFIFTNFKNFLWNLMIFPWSWKRSEFQWFFKSCGNPVWTYGIFLFDRCHHS